MNQATVITSPILANCIRTNTNAIPLGSTEQAKAIMYYLIKYILKDKTALKSTLSVVSYALKKLAEYPSRATNTGTDQRSGVHLLQAIINKINGTCEIADTQAAAVCLGLPCVETSCHTTYVFIHAAIAVVTERLDIDAGHDDPEKAWDEDHIHHQNLDPEEADNEYGEQFSLEQAFLYEEELEFDRIQDEETYSSHIDLGNVPIVKTTTSSKEVKEVKMIAHPQDMDYAYRGKALKDLSLVEYACVIEILKRRSDKEQPKSLHAGDADRGSRSLHKTCEPASM